MTLYENIRRAAKERGLSLQEVATKSGLSSNMIYQYKNVNPKMDTIKEIAKTLNVSVDYLLGNTDEMHPTTKDNSTPQEVNLDEALQDKGVVMKFNGKDLSDTAKRGILNILEMLEEDKNDSNNLEEVDALLNMKIYQAGIQLFEDEWESDDPDVAVRTNDDEYVIIMNKNFSTPFTPVHRKAHEFSHLLYSDMQHGEAYHFSPYLKKKDEVVANQGAIKLLTELIYQDMPLEERDWMKFMEVMNLPAEYEKIVQECVRMA